MKRLCLILFILVLSNLSSFATEPNELSLFSRNNCWGIKDSQNNVVVKPIYKKMIRLGDSSLIVQKGSKFGLIDYNGNVLVPIKYTHAERLLGKFLKIGNGQKYGLYNDLGEELLPVEYSSVDLLFGGMFLTCKNYKYGVIDQEGGIILLNRFEEIYMPKPNIMRIKYLGEWYEIQQIDCNTLNLPEIFSTGENENDLLLTKITEHPIATTGYSAVAFTDYLIKLFSSISPAHEKTIDSLMLSQGADVVGIYFKFSWIPKYPVVFIKNYYNILKNPNSGPLSEIKSELKSKTNAQ